VWKVVWSAGLEQSAPIERKNIQALMNAMSIAAGRLMENACGGVSQVIERETAWKQEQGPAQEVEET
jgi:NAD(P)H-hydrate repair Nnr-like enzyme with NAD(P)H-hydrate epimerase domain